MFADEKGFQGDTLIFNVSNANKAIQISKFMEERGLGTKILPEAFEWHFAGSWNHIFKDIDYYKHINIKQQWSATEKLLRKSICINIPVKLSHQRCDEIVKIIKEGCKLYG